MTPEQLFAVAHGVRRKLIRDSAIIQGYALLPAASDFFFDVSKDETDKYVIHASDHLGISKRALAALYLEA